jgi:3-isopropylmalate dehydratase small subunit
MSQTGDSFPLIWGCASAIADGYAPIFSDNCIKQLVRWQSDREWDEAGKIEKARGGMHRYWAQRAQPWD